MQIQLQGRDLELTPDIKEYAEKKVEALTKFFTGDIEVFCDVELAHRTERGKPYAASINCSYEGKVFHASAEGDTVHEAIDLMKDEITREVRKAEDKKETLFRKGARRIKEMFRGVR